ncbi:nicotinamide/nicotinic acid mononucleotide adenylyltransferase 1 [Narcine bancroftii]|uniref:nicotinamide/nicotinic acid mononucleotide adenylyltransferase 1 n=1 Tax=Narcine bancroftii TaxID=1343680 RepID=UPI003831D5DA
MSPRVVQLMRSTWTSVRPLTRSYMGDWSKRGAVMENFSSCTEVVLLSCGSFNPVTNMHLRMFELARDYLHETGKYRVIKGIISPVSDAYKKKGLIEACHRVAMIEKAIECSDWVTLDTWECEQDVWLETVKVLRHHYVKLQKLHGNDKGNFTQHRRAKKRKAEDKDVCSLDVKYTCGSGTVKLMLLCGGDVLESFGVPNLWKKEDIEEILGRFGVVCINRLTCNLQKCIYESDIIWKFRNKIHLVHEWIVNDISATKVRRALRRGQSVKFVIPDPVIEYIHRHQLYDQESEDKNSDVLLAPFKRYNAESSQSSLQCYELDGFYTQCNHMNKEEPTLHIPISPNNPLLSVSKDDVWVVFRRVNLRKPSGSHGVPSQVFKICADQLANVFTKLPRLPWFLHSAHRSTYIMPTDFNGTWKMISNKNLDPYLQALDIDFAIRKIAALLKPEKIIEQNGDSFIIKTNSTFRNYQIQFTVGEEFDEDVKCLDNRKCKSLVIWDNNKLVCTQKGEKKNRGWTHWMEGDDLHLELYCENQVCKQVYKKISTA